jgi:hypothetical protein
MKNLNLKPDDFLQYILETINKTGDIIDEKEFSEYTEKNPEVWDTNKYDDIFYIIVDYIQERIPKKVFSLNNLREDIKFYLSKKDLLNKGF